MKLKLNIFLVVLFLMPGLCFGLWRNPDGSARSAANVDSMGNTQISTQTPIEVVTRTDDNWNILQPYTTGCFSVSLTSAPVASSTHQVRGLFRATRSSGTFIISLIETSDIGATTNYIQIQVSSMNTYTAVVDMINSKANWSATLSQGCYGEQSSTGTAIAYDDGTLGSLEGLTDGLQYSWLPGGKLTVISTGTANARTIYSNATQYISYRKASVVGKKHSIGYIEARLTWVGSAAGTITVYEGTTSTTCATQLNVPIPIVSTILKYSSSYLEPYCLNGTGEYAQRYEVWLSTYISTGWLGVMGKTK